MNLFTLPLYALHFPLPPHNLNLSSFILFNLCIFDFVPTDWYGFWHNTFCLGLQFSPSSVHTSHLSQNNISNIGTKLNFVVTNGTNLIFIAKIIGTNCNFVTKIGTNFNFVAQKWNKLGLLWKKLEQTQNLLWKMKQT